MERGGGGVALCGQWADRLGVHEVDTYTLIHSNSVLITTCPTSAHALRPQWPSLAQHRCSKTPPFLICELVSPVSGRPGRQCLRPSPSAALLHPQQCETRAH